MIEGRNSMVSDVVDLESPDDIALADRMKAGGSDRHRAARRSSSGSEEVISRC
jgi:hypothetical protein